MYQKSHRIFLVFSTTVVPVSFGQFLSEFCRFPCKNQPSNLWYQWFPQFPIYHHCVITCKILNILFQIQDKLWLAGSWKFLPVPTTPNTKPFIGGHFLETHEDVFKPIHITGENTKFPMTSLMLFSANCWLSPIAGGRGRPPPLWSYLPPLKDFCLLRSLVLPPLTSPQKKIVGETQSDLQPGRKLQLDGYKTFQHKHFTRSKLQWVFCRYRNTNKDTKCVR